MAEADVSPLPTAGVVPISVSPVKSVRSDAAYGAAMLLFIAFANASNMILARWNLGLVPPYSLAFFRFMVVGSILAPLRWAEIRMFWPQIRARWPMVIAAGFCGMFLCGAPAYTAGETTTAIDIGLVMAATPIVVILLSWILGLEKIRPLQISGICIALPGVVLILCGGTVSTFAAIHVKTGDLIILITMMGWSAFTLIQLRTVPGLSPWARTAIFAYVGAAFNLPICIVDAIETPHAVFSGHAALVYLFAGVVPGIAAFVGYGVFANRFGPVRASLSMYVTPIAGVILSMLLLSEGPSLYHLIGGLFILGGVWLSFRR